MGTAYLSPDSEALLSPLCSAHTRVPTGNRPRDIRRGSGSCERCELRRSAWCKERELTIYGMVLDPATIGHKQDAMGGSRSGISRLLRDF